MTAILHSRGRALLVPALFLLLAASSPASSRAVEPLSAFLDQLLMIQSVHVEANGALHLKMESVSRGGTGKFRYWEQGNLFRVACETDKNLGLMGDIEWGYDGYESRGWFKANNSIVSNTSLDREAPTALPNPFFLPVSFLFSQEACPMCRTSLQKLIQARQNMTVSQLTKHDDTLLIGSTEFAQEYTVDVVRRDGMDVPWKISWVDPIEDAEMEVTLGDYRSTDGIVWPTSIEAKLKNLRDPDGMSMRTKFYLTTLAFNYEMDMEVFRLMGDSETHYPEEDPSLP